MKTITVEQFKAGLSTLTDGGNVILTITTRTVPKMRKTNNPYFGRVYKISVSNGSIGTDYEAAKNRVLAKNGQGADFVAGPHQWAEHVSKAISTNKDGTKEYLNYIEKSSTSKWYLDGEEVDKSLFYEWMDKPRHEDVKYRNPYLDNILSVRWGGEDYLILPSFPVESASKAG